MPVVTSVCDIPCDRVRQQEVYVGTWDRTHEEHW
jgi:hypothetical protein